MGLLDDIDLLRPEDFNIIRMRTGHTCAACNQDVEADDDVALLQVAQTQINQGVPEIYPLLDAEGDFRFSPQFIHLKGCWQDAFDDLERAVEDLTPRKDAQSKLTCDVCQDGIREWEIMSIAQYGEFHSSRRRPNGTEQFTYVFQPFKDNEENSNEICLSCILNLVGNVLTPWEDISENGECVYCSKARCWRVAQCRCECHNR